MARKTGKTTNLCEGDENGKESEKGEETRKVKKSREIKIDGETTIGTEGEDGKGFFFVIFYWKNVWGPRCYA
jgi:hypothetical protein